MSFQKRKKRRKERRRKKRRRLRRERRGGSGFRWWWHVLMDGGTHWHTGGENLDFDRPKFFLLRIFCDKSAYYNIFFLSFFFLVYSAIHLTSKWELSKGFMVLTTLQKVPSVLSLPLPLPSLSLFPYPSFPLCHSHITFSKESILCLWSCHQCADRCWIWSNQPSGMCLWDFYCIQSRHHLDCYSFLYIMSLGRPIWLANSSV